MVCSENKTTAVDVYDFETFGSNDSKCVNTMGNIDRPLCLSVHCIITGGELMMVVTANDGEKVTCEKDGQLIDLPDLDVKIECPRQEVVCPECVRKFS